MKSKFASLVLCAVLSFSAFAEDTNKTQDHGGDGTSVATGSDGTVNVESVYQKYKQRHADTIQSLQEASEMLQKLIDKKDNPPSLVLSAAIATELIRLKKETTLFTAFDNGSIKKDQYVTLMAENSITLDHMQRLAAFAKSAYSIWDNREGPLNEKDFFAATAKGFDEFYTDDDRKKSAFNDVEIRDLAVKGRQTLPIFQATFAPDEAKRLEFRAKYYPQYADRILKQNAAILQQSQDELNKKKTDLSREAVGDMP